MERSTRLGLVMLLGGCLLPADLGLTQGASKPSLTVAAARDRTIQLSWPANAQSFLLERADALSQKNSWQTVTQTPVRQGELLSLTISPTGQAQFFRLHQVEPVATWRLSGVTPSDGATAVGVTVHPRIVFSHPVNQATLTTNNFYASFGSQVLPANIVPAQDGSFAWLFFQQPMPGGARVRVTVDGG